VFTEDQLDEGIKREEYDKMTYDASDDASDDDDDENAEDIYLDKPNSSYRKLVGLLQVNKKRKVDKMKKENVDINKTDKVDIAKSDLGNKEVEMKYESGLQQESGRNKKDSGEKKEREREGKDEEEEQGKAEGSSNEDDEREDEENEKGIF
jgi:hypothetical protein